MYCLKSFAKINLGLEITGKREDGYHTLKTIFQTINLCDKITIFENSTGKIVIRGDDTSIEWDNPGTNTILKAISIIYENYGLSQGFNIFVQKRIPAGSGLAGGSSNAAVMLLFLANYFNLPLSLEEMIPIAARIGADVPFFLVGGTVLAEGIGEEMILLDDDFFPSKWIDIVIPPALVSTRLIFSHFSLTSGPITSKIDTFIKSKNPGILENNLEKVTFGIFPEVGKIKTQMNTIGYELVMMSGSGSSVYGMEDMSAAGTKQLNYHQRESRLLTHFPGCRTIVCKLIGRQEYFASIGASPSGKASVFGSDIRRFKSSRPSF